MAGLVSTFYPGEVSGFFPPPEAELATIAREVLDALRASGVAIALEDGGHIICRARAGAAAPQLGAQLDHNEGISGRCIRENSALLVSDTDSEDAVNQEACRALGIRSLAVSPIRHDSCVIGILEVFSRIPRFFIEDDLRFLDGCAAKVAGRCASAADVSLKQEPARSGIHDEASTVLFMPAPAEIDGCKKSISVESASGVPAASADLSGQRRRPKAGDTPLGSEVPVTKHRRRWWKWPTLLASVALVAAIGVFTYRPAFRHDVETQRAASLPANPTADKLAPQSSAAPAASSLANSAIAKSAATAAEDSALPAKDLFESARSGDSGAQLTLADHYARGDESDKDAVRAAAWYIVAGIAGNSQAKETATELTAKLPASQIAQIRFRVGEMLRDGTGIPPDLGAAYSWFVLAQVAGDPRAQAEEKKLAAVMKPSEIADARSRAANWRAGKK